MHRALAGQMRRSANAARTQRAADQAADATVRQSEAVRTIRREQVFSMLYTHENQGREREKFACLLSCRTC